MLYGEAMELLIDGIVTHQLEDITAYGDSRRFYCDRRTIHNVSPERDIVKPLGRTLNRYWLYICVDCGLIHSIHDDLVRSENQIVCGCRIGKKSRSRLILGDNGKAVKVPAHKIILDLKGISNEQSTETSDFMKDR